MRSSERGFHRSAERLRGAERISDDVADTDWAIELESEVWSQEIGSESHIVQERECERLVHCPVLWEVVRNPGTTMTVGGVVVCVRLRFDVACCYPITL